MPEPRIRIPNSVDDKLTPVGNDYLLLMDSEDGMKPKNITITNLLANTSPVIESVQDIIPIEYAEDGETPPNESEQVTIGDMKLRVRQFSDSAPQDVVFGWRVPSNINEANMSIRFRVGLLLTGDTTGGVSTIFSLRAFRADGRGMLDNTFTDSPVAVTSRYEGSPDTGELVVSNWSGSYMITDIVPGSFIAVKVDRNTDAAEDTYAENISVANIEIGYEVVK